MIDAAREWLTGIITVTVLISVAQTLMPPGTVRKTGAFTGGLILIAALLGPFVRPGFDWPEWDLREYQTAMEQREKELRTRGDREFALLVGEKIRTLIVTHAADMGIHTDAAVRIEMDDGIPIPYAVKLECPRSTELEAWITTELGIPPEHQTWGTADVYLSP